MQKIKTMLFSLFRVVVSPLNAKRAFLQPNATWLKAGASDRMQMWAVCGGGTEPLTPRSLNDVSAPVDGVMQSPGGALCLTRVAEATAADRSADLGWLQRLFADDSVCIYSRPNRRSIMLQI